jgi:ribonuclease G
MDLILRSIRDLFTADVGKVLVDRAVDYQRILDFVDSFAPRLKSRIELAAGPEPLFDQYGIEPAISRALERRVWLKSGGYIVIDQTEALTTIDVNTGRYVGKSSQEETILKTNLEAAREIVDQLRVRNIGGIIIIDFIDMVDPASRQCVMDALETALKQDKMRSTILNISELGLVEMTRKRTRPSLAQVLTSHCPSCDGKGRIKSVATIAYEIMRRVRTEAQVTPGAGRIVVRAHAAVAAFLCEDESMAMDQLEREIGRRITVEPIDAPDHARFEVLAA